MPAAPLPSPLSLPSPESPSPKSPSPELPSPESPARQPGTQLSVNAPAIQWYPGHIAKAEKALHAALAKVDLVIEVRDARIPLSTGHPRLRRWIGTKQHLLVLNRRDMVPVAAQQALERQDEGPAGGVVRGQRARVQRRLHAAVRGGVEGEVQPDGRVGVEPALGEVGGRGRRRAA